MMKTMYFAIMIGAAVVFFLISPFMGFVMLVALLCVYHLVIKMSHLEHLMTPLRKDETLALYFTKKRKVFLEKWWDKAEGYLGQPEWGTTKVTYDSALLFHGKPCVIAMEGVAHTAKIEDVLTAWLMQRAGVHGKPELKKALGIPKEEPVKAARREMASDTGPGEGNEVENEDNTP